MPLEPLSYHVEIVHYLQDRESELWKWFAADRLRGQQNEAVRLDLLKTTYRIERENNAQLYDSAYAVGKALGLKVPLTFYQSQHAGGLNAALAYMPGEAHIIFAGQVLSALSDSELRCVLGHELTHFSLLDGWPDYLIATQLLAALTNDATAQPVHAASARLLKLYTEVYCDRGAFRAVGDLAAAITALVKIETGITDVSADSYLRQTAEVFAKGHPRAEGMTHPETFIRARALQLWAEQPKTAASQISQIIEGPPSLEELDLLGQEKVSGLTRRLIATYLRPSWLQTDPTLAHARLFFDDFTPRSTTDPVLPDDLHGADAKLRDYYCYVLLDFAVADRDLEDAPLAAALLLSDELGLGERFRQIAAKELNLRKKQLDALETDASKIIAKAQEEIA